MQIFDNIKSVTDFAAPIIERGCKVEIKEWKPTRSNRQNRFYWACMKVIADHTGHSDKEIHEYLKNEYLHGQVVQIFGKRIEQKLTTTTLNIKDFAEYMEKIIVFSHVELNCILPDPTDYELMRIAEFYKNYIN